MEEESSLVIDDDQSGGTVLENLAELALLLGDLRLALGQGGDVVDPAKTLAADKADMPAPVGDLDVRDQQVNELALLRLPDHLLVQQLAALVLQCRDDPRPLLEVMPERAGVDELELLLLVAQELPQARTVEQQAAVLVDDDQRRRAQFQHLAKLALVLGDLCVCCHRRP